jgi:hypothetical protein
LLALTIFCKNIADTELEVHNGENVKIKVEMVPAIDS